MFWEERYIPYTQSSQDFLKVGCASHSDFQSERERVLDEVISVIYKHIGDDYCGFCNKFIKDIEELRQVKE
jgi:rRNA pseudouridine-1189 N-methylase Emg1 (Nep1/Mra1 family)